MRGGSQTSLIWKCRHIYTNACFNQIRKRKKSLWSDLVRFPWFLKRDPLSYFLFVVFFLGQSGLLEPCTDSLLQNPAKNVVNHAVAHALFLSLQVYRSEGGQTTVLLLIDSYLGGGGNVKAASESGSHLGSTEKPSFTAAKSCQHQHKARRGSTPHCGYL